VGLPAIRATPSSGASGGVVQHDLLQMTNLDLIMSEYRPYERWDYRINDLLVGEDEPLNNQLLGDNEKVAQRPPNESIKGLAAIADALDSFGQEMTPEHIEKAVWWMKDWKMHRSGWYPKIDSDIELQQSMEKLKSCVAFRKLGVRAKRYSYGSHLFAVLSGVAALAALNVWTNDSSWAPRIGWALGFAVLSILTVAFRDTARDIWQEQDRRYFLQCLRLCRCTDDLLQAGLFAYHPKTEKVHCAEEGLAFRKAVREMQAQLGDALYFDFDNHIRESPREREKAHSWNWPKGRGNT